MRLTPTVPALARRFGLIAATSALLALTVVGPVVAAGVRNAPQARGLLELGNRDCTTQRAPDAVTTSCSYIYFVDPTQETAREKYSVAWTQVRFQPRAGWCLTGARGTIDQAGSDRVTSIPDRPLAPGRHQVRMVLDAHGRRLGVLQQTFQLSRGQVSTTPGSGNRFGWKWRGYSREDPVVIVVGAAFARVPSENESVITLLTTELKTAPC
jgi:hypothetical protein